MSERKSPNSGIPRGTKLGVILFLLMTKNLISDWYLRTEFVDDTAALEISNSIMRPIVIRSNVVENVSSYKIVGVRLTADLKVAPYSFLKLLNAHLKQAY